MPAPMFGGRILVATDGSELSTRAIELAVGLARNLQCSLVAFTAMPVYPYAGIGESSGVAAADHQARVGAEAGERLAAIEMQARDAGVECQTSMREDNDPSRSIVDAAERHACGLIVMGSHGRSGVQALVLGSQTQRVLATTTIPVLVVR